MSRRPVRSFNRASCQALDAADSLRAYRELFHLPENTIYLDGNSLGALPKATPPRLETVLREEWGKGLIRSWNQHAWVTLPQRVGRKLAPILGAGVDEVIITDSTSVNIFKLLAGALAMPDVQGRRVILSERGNFPTDLYVAEGLNAMLGGKYLLKLVESDQLADAIDSDVAVALVTQVDYCSGRLRNMADLNKCARAVGTRVVWDLSHSAGAVELALNQDGAELAVGCGYKYLNGGPGAPSFVYVAKALQADFDNPLSGWFGHRAPFEFSSAYAPSAGIERLLCGTPSVIAMAGLECGIDTFADTTMLAIRTKSVALSELFRELIAQECGKYDLRCVSPVEPGKRGSQLSFAHEQAYAIMQAIIERGVIGDFRQPDLMRFGFTPLYVRFVDCWDAVAAIRDVMSDGAWRDDKYHQRNTVT